MIIIIIISVQVLIPPGHSYLGLNLCVQLAFLYRRFVLSPESVISSKLAGIRASQYGPWVVA